MHPRGGQAALIHERQSCPRVYCIDFPTSHPLRTIMMATSTIIRTPTPERFFLNRKARHCAAQSARTALHDSLPLQVSSAVNQRHRLTLPALASTVGLPHSGVPNSFSQPLHELRQTSRGKKKPNAVVTLHLCRCPPLFPSPGCIHKAPHAVCQARFSHPPAHHSTASCPPCQTQ